MQGASGCKWVAMIARNIRSNLPEVFCEKGLLRNCAKFARKHLRQGLFFNKGAGLRPATLIKRRLWHSCFPVIVAKFLRIPFFIEHSGDCFWNIARFFPFLYCPWKKTTTYKRNVSHHESFQKGFVMFSGGRES